MPFVRFILLSFFATVLIACGSTGNNKEYEYLNARISKPLVMPDGLSPPRGTQVVLVPNVPVDTVDLTDDLVLPPQIVKSVDLAELESAKSKSASASRPQTAKGSEPVPVALLSKQTTTPDGDSMLLVDGKFDDVWPAVAPAVKELGFTIDDASRGAQIYTITKEVITVNIEPVHPGDEKPPTMQEYQLHLKQAGDKTQITVHNKYGELERSGLSDHLLLQIQEILANPVKQSEGED